MTACIVGWSHLAFGRRDHDDVESMICSVASKQLTTQVWSSRYRRHLFGAFWWCVFPTRLHVKPGFSILGCVAFQACYRVENACATGSALCIRA